MCLSVAIHRPDDVLARGKHEGFEWMVIHNGRGYRCGYVRVPQGHPWYGKEYDDVAAEVHGGLTFARADVACDKDGPDDGWWIGFDCAHSGDAADPALPLGDDAARERDFLARFSPIAPARRFRDTIRTQEYVEAECRSLCEQAASAVGEAEQREEVSGQAG